MPRLKIIDLSSPDEGFRPGVDGYGGEAFDKKLRCRREDLARKKGVEKAITRFPHIISVQSARSLAHRLGMSGENGEFVETLASSLQMGRFRYRIGGAVWKLYASCPGDRRPTTFTVIPASWEFTPDNLEEANPANLMETLRVDLYQYGKAQSAGGWMIAALHGEYDPEAKVYRLHVHGLASPEMIGALDRLRTLPRYRSVRKLPDGSWSPVYRRIRVDRKPLVNLPAPLTYMLQSFWPSRAILISKDGRRHRVRDKHRIAEPYHSQVLLWLDRWKIDDLFLRIGLRVSNAGFAPTH